MFNKKTLIIITSWIISVILISSALAYYQNYKTLSNLGDILAFAAGTFLGLSDTPSSYSGQAGKVVKVNSSEDALEFGTAGGGGSAILCAVNENLVAGGETRYGTFNGGVTFVDSAATTEKKDYRTFMPKAGTVKNFYVQLTSPVEGTGETAVFTIRKNSVDQSLTITLNSGETTGSDTTHSFTVAAGDYLTVKCVSSAGAGSGLEAMMAIEIEW